MKSKSSRPGQLHPLLLSGALLATASATFAQSTYVWDADAELGPDTGGSGVWDATSSLWRNADAAGPLGIWPNTEGNTDTALFGGISGTVTLNPASETININRITFDSTGFEIAPPASGTATLNLTGTTPTITTGNSVSATITAGIAGTSGLTRGGNGTLNLAGNNTYTGTTTIASPNTGDSFSGIVNVSGDQSAATGGWTINGDSTVNFLAGSTIVVGAGRNISLGNGNSSANFSLNVFGKVNSPGTLNVRGRRILNLESGAEWIHGGPINIQTLNSTYSATVNVKTGASFTYDGTSNIVLARATSGGNGSGTLNISGGTFTTRRAFTNAASGTGTGSTNLNLSSGGILRLSAHIPSLLLQSTTTPRVFNVTTGAGGGTIDTNGFNTAIQPAISGAGSLTKAGQGNLILNGENTYTGPTSVTAGRLSLGATGSINASSAISLAAGTTLDTTSRPSFTASALQPLTLGIDTTGPGSTGILSATDLNLSDAVVNLEITGTPDDPVYVLATYTGTLTGTETAQFPAPPAGYTLDFSYQGNKIALTNGNPAGFANWRTTNNTMGGLNDDHDNDGVANGIEYFLAGPNTPATGFTTQPGVQPDGNTSSITWTHSPDYTGVYGIDFRVETSSTLEAPWTVEPVGVNVSIIGNQLTYTFPAGTRGFARLVVTGP